MSTNDYGKFCPHSSLIFEVYSVPSYKCAPRGLFFELVELEKLVEEPPTIDPAYPSPAPAQAVPFQPAPAYQTVPAPPVVSGKTTAAVSL